MENINKNEASHVLEYYNGSGTGSSDALQTSISINVCLLQDSEYICKCKLG